MKCDEQALKVITFFQNELKLKNHTFKFKKSNKKCGRYRSEISEKIFRMPSKKLVVLTIRIGLLLKPTDRSIFYRHFEKISNKFAAIQARLVRSGCTIMRLNFDRRFFFHIKYNKSQSIDILPGDQKQLC